MVFLCFPHRTKHRPQQVKAGLTGLAVCWVFTGSQQPSCASTQLIPSFHHPSLLLHVWAHALIPGAIHGPRLSVIAHWRKDEPEPSHHRVSLPLSKVSSRKGQSFFPTTGVHPRHRARVWSSDSTAGLGPKLSESWAQTLGPVVVVLFPKVSP